MKNLISERSEAIANNSGAMETGNHFKNGTCKKKRTGGKFVLLLLWALSIKAYGYDEPKITIKGNITDSVYIVFEDQDCYFDGHGYNHYIWKTKLPATITGPYVTYYAKTFKIYAENFKITDVVVPTGNWQKVTKKKFEVDCEKIVRSERENFDFWTNLGTVFLNANVNTNKSKGINDNDKRHQYANYCFKKALSNIDESALFGYRYELGKLLMQSRYKYRDEKTVKTEDYVQKVFDDMNLTADRRGPRRIERVTM
jgi:hypothetical protein